MLLHLQSRSLFDLKNGGSTFIQNVDEYHVDYTASADDTNLTRRRENLKSHSSYCFMFIFVLFMLISESFVISITLACSMKNINLNIQRCESICLCIKERVYAVFHSEKYEHFALWKY
jgi:hypothetical protein